MARLLSAAAALAHCFAGAAAWSTAGHRRIADVALAVLNDRQKAQVQKMLGASLADVADQEEKTVLKWPETQYAHYHMQEPACACSTGGFDTQGHLHCEAEQYQDTYRKQGGSILARGLLCSAGTIFYKYAHHAHLREYPKAKNPLMQHPDDMEVGFDKYVQDKMADFNLKDDHALLWFLVSFIGDMFSPFHYMTDYTYGNDVKLQFHGSEYTLLSFWENFLPEHLRRMPTQKQLERQFKSVKTAAGAACPVELFREWGKEAAPIACQKVYARIEVDHGNGTRSIEPGFELKEALYWEWLDAAETLIHRAGLHVAYVLLDLLEHRKHLFAALQGRGLHHHRRSWSSQFLKNALIAVVLVPGILFLFRWHLSASSTTLFRGSRHHRTS